VKGQLHIAGIRKTKIKTSFCDITTCSFAV